MDQQSTSFKEKLIHLRQDFYNYLQYHKTKTIPIDKVGIMVQKFFPSNPLHLQHFLQKSRKKPKQNNLTDGISWQQLLICLQQQIQLRDKVNKLSYSRPPTCNVHFKFLENGPIDNLIDSQKFSLIINQVKKKQTNFIRSAKKCQFLGLNLLAIVLDEQVMFYDCTKYSFKQDNKQKIIKRLNFNYHNVRSKMINKKLLASESQAYQNTEKIDKVNPISRRTEQLGIGLKDRKNTTNSEQSKNNCIQLKKNKMQSSQCSDYSQIKRSVTDSSKISRNLTSIGRHRWNNKSLKGPKMSKIKSNDTKTAFRIMTEAPIKNSIQFVRAFQNSRQNFEKYVIIQKHKIQKQQFIEMKKPTAKEMKQNFNSQILKMKKDSVNFSRNSQPQNSQSFSIKKNKIRNSSIASLKSQTNTPNSFYNQKNNSTDACKILQKKQLQIQSLSFCDNYLLVSLINRQIRLYSFRKTINGFTQSLIFQKPFPVLISYVLLYKSKTRNLYNLIIVKMDNDQYSTLSIIELDQSMQIYQQSFSCQLEASPLFEEMLPLGLGGFRENGYVFLVEVNSVLSFRKQCLTLEEVIKDNEKSQKLSLTSMKMHSNCIYFYLGTKNGQICIYDRFSHMMRIQSKVSKYSIDKLFFINEGKDLLCWDRGGRIGIINSQTLEVSQFYTSSTTLNYFQIEPYFNNQNFLLFANRGMGIVTLQHDEQKQYSFQRQIKLFNRRKKLTNKLLKVNLRQKINATQKEERRKKNRHITDSFISERGIILILSDFQILIFDQKYLYVGSFFTFGIENIVFCSVCSQNQFLSILYENDQIEIVNIFNQQNIFRYSSKQTIRKFFFCGSSVHFCGMITSASNLYIFGFQHDNFSQSAKPLIVKSMSDILTIPSNDDSFSIKFYRGVMIWINFSTSQIIFFNKRLFSRSKILSLRQQNNINLGIAEVKQNQKGYLSVIRKDCTFFYVNLTKKQIEFKVALNISVQNPKLNSLYHYYDVNRMHVWIIQEQKNQSESNQQIKYMLKRLQINGQDPNYKKLLQQKQLAINRNNEFIVFFETIGQINMADMKIYDSFLPVKKNQNHKIILDLDDF